MCFQKLTGTPPINVKSINAEDRIFNCDFKYFLTFTTSDLELAKDGKVFLDTVGIAGYDGLLYSSKTYLEKIWLDIDYEIWLAHYTSKTNDEGDYRFWQRCNNGRVEGITGDVDIDIMYLD